MSTLDRWLKLGPLSSSDFLAQTRDTAEVAQLLKVDGVGGDVGCEEDDIGGGCRGAAPPETGIVGRGVYGKKGEGAAGRGPVHGGGGRGGGCRVPRHMESGGEDIGHRRGHRQVGDTSHVAGDGFPAGADGEARLILDEVAAAGAIVPVGLHWGAVWVYGNGRGAGE